MNETLIFNPEADREQSNQVETTQVGGRIYENDKLREFAETLSIVEMPLDDVREAVGEEHVYWEDRNGDQLAPFQIIQDWDAAQQNDAWRDHVDSIKRANLQNPIWLTKDGHVFDGVHRLTRAVIDNNASVKVRIFDEIPESIQPVS